MLMIFVRDIMCVCACLCISLFCLFFVCW